MFRRFVSTVCPILAGVAVVWIVSPASADVVTNQKHSADFSYKIGFEGSSLPTGWAFHTGDGPCTIGDGAVTLGPTNGPGKGALYSTGAGSWWQDFPATKTTGYTVEFALQVLRDSGINPAFIAFQSTGESDAFCPNVWIGANTVMNWYSSWPGNPIVLSTADNTDAYHTFRIAVPAGTNGNISVWRDGVLLGYDLPQGFPWDDRQFWYGGGAGGIDSQVKMDWLRANIGAWAPAPAPAPQPSSMMLLISATVGLLASAWRKRR